MATGRLKTGGAGPPPNPVPWWAPRFWVGADFFGWIRLLAKNRFRVDLAHWHMAAVATLYGLFNTVLRWIQEPLYRGRIAAIERLEPPIFILGHWRCGTTLLHELLILDQRHTFPNTYQCFAPNHFLISERIGTKALKWLLPKQRPMDNMPLGWDRPQEDEFALCNLGIPSLYLTILFPNEPPQYPQYLDLEGLSAEELARWKAAFVKFLKQVSYRNPKRIVLKSPPHTARIKVLAELFPDARFVHIVRDPYVLFPSTIHLWKSLFQTQGFQTPTFAGLEEFVYSTFNRLHCKFREARHLIAPNRLVELRYEDLLRDPAAQMQSLYERLELGDFSDVRPKIEAYFAAQRSYKTNRYQLDAAVREEIGRRWSDYIATYGYCSDGQAFEEARF
jgi:hypothetical protein